MRKYQKHAQTGSNDNATTPFAQACQQMHLAANACLNWLIMAQRGSLQMVHAEMGCARSTRLARLHPGSHELSPQSALQLVVMPTQFDDVRQHGYDHQRWQTLIYSWLGRELTEQLRQHLASKMNMKNCKFFLVRSGECEKVADYSDRSII